jgi:hypothetical protein
MARIAWTLQYKTIYSCVLHPIVHVKTAMDGVLKAEESWRFVHALVG